MRKLWRKAKKEEFEIQLDDVSLHRNSLRPELDAFGRPVHHRQLRHYASVPHTLGSHANTMMYRNSGDGRYGLPMDDMRFASHHHHQGLQRHPEEFDYMRRGSVTSQGTSSTSWNSDIAHSSSLLPSPQSGGGGGGGQMFSHPHPESSMQAPSPVVVAPPQIHPSNSHGMGVGGGGEMNSGGLPPDSTLLTPLPGYQPPTLLPPPGAGYEAYDRYGRVYQDDGRSGAGQQESMGGVNMDGQYIM
jgi:transcription factor CON7